MQTDNPEVQQFVAKEADGQNQVTIRLGPHVGMITTSKWPRDENNEVSDIGVSQTITVSRHELIGLAYEILHSV